jgi:hypothetical protein
MDRTHGWALAIVLLGGLLVGCQSEEAKQRPLRVSDEARLSDVDVPAGFRYESDKSWIRADAQLRLAQLRYRGSPSMDKTTEFFLNQMPLRNWKLSHQTENFGNVSLVFSKGPEVCTITLYRSWGTTHLRIELGKRAD